VGIAQVKLTVPVKPLRAVAEIAVCPDWPGAAIAKLLGDAPMLKSGVPLEMLIASADDVEPE
jgi:hypothetical protein